MTLPWLCGKMIYPFLLSVESAFSDWCVVFHRSVRTLLQHHYDYVDYMVGKKSNIYWVSLDTELS